MQPYFLPYIGYFQLIRSADVFVVYDDIKYTKKGWINRNRFLLNNRDELFSLPLRKDSDHLHVRDRQLAQSFDKKKLLSKLKEAYRAAPCFEEVFPLIEAIVDCTELNLFGFILNSLEQVCAHLGIETPLVASSTLGIDHDLSGQGRVLATCKRLGADAYINSIGGRELYSHEDFAACNIKLQFLQPRACNYRQFGHPFVPWLSILDVMMFNDAASIRQNYLGNYDLI